MASLPSKPRPTPQRTLRYNAKTSLSTRYADDFDEPDYLLRTIAGTLAPDVISMQASVTAGSKPARKRARQEDPDYVDESEPRSFKESNKPRTRNSAPQTKPSTTSMQLVDELHATCDIDTDSVSHEPKPQQTLFLSACSLPCNRFSLTASASASSQTPASIDIMLMKPVKASAPLKSTLHWHIHTHSVGQDPHSHERLLDFIPDNKLPCIDLQVLEGALARMYSEKPWPADKIVLAKFHGINGRYEYEVVGDWHLP